MARFISYKGMFFPALEKVSLKYKGKTPVPKDKLSKYIIIDGDVLNPGDPYIYKGPDREAMYMLKEQGLEYLGQDFEHDPEFLQKCRTLNFNTVKEYLEFIGYDVNKDKERFSSQAQQVSLHNLPSREDEAFILAGGKDSSGADQNDIIGGFGDPKIRPATEIRIRKQI